MATDSHETSGTWNDLPNELLQYIFEHLATKDLAQCRLVCKRFQLVCTDIKIPEVIISRTTGNMNVVRNFLNDRWFHTKRHFNHQEAIDMTTFNSNRSMVRWDKLRRLHFEGNYAEYAQLNVNDSTRLEQLRVDVKDATGVTYEIYINLPNVKIIEIDTHSSKNAYTFVITAPKLEVLKCSDFDVVRLKHPETIVEIETKDYRHGLLDLKNVETLRIDNGMNAQTYWGRVMPDFPKLKTFACRPFSNVLAVENVIRQDQRLHGLKLHFPNIDPNDDFDDGEEVDENGLSEFQIDFYKSLEIIVWDFKVSYSELMSLKREITDDFHFQFVRVRYLHVSGRVGKVKEIYHVINSFRDLTEIRTEMDSHEQGFYDAMVSLNQLATITVITHSVPISNFDFLLKFKLLESFSTDSESPKLFDITLDLFSHSPKFQSINFSFGENRFTICKNVSSNDHYDFSCSSYRKCALDFDGLVRELGEFRSPPINHPQTFELMNCTKPDSF